MASLIGDGESGDLLMDENEPICTLQQPEVEDYTDPNWEPEPIDVGPSMYSSSCLIISCQLTGTTQIFELINQFSQHLRLEGPIRERAPSLAGPATLGN